MPVSVRPLPLVSTAGFTTPDKRITEKEDSESTAFLRAHSRFRRPNAFLPVDHASLLSAALIAAWPSAAMAALSREFARNARPSASAQPRARLHVVSSS